MLRPYQLNSCPHHGRELSFPALTTSNDPIVFSFRNAYAALIVAAAIASAGVIRNCVQAKDKIIAMLKVGLVPGLKSVASATIAPASINSRAGAYFFNPK